MEDEEREVRVVESDSDSDPLERDPEPPLRAIGIALALLCGVVIVGFLWFALKPGNTPEKECAYRGGQWLFDSKECVFESAEGTGKERVGMKVSTVTLVVPEIGKDAVVFSDVEVGAPYKEKQAFGTGETPDGVVALIAEWGRVQKETGDLIMPFAVQSGGSGTFVYLGVFEKVDDGFTLRDSLFAGDRIGPQGLTLGSLDENQAFSARLAYRDRRSGEPYSEIPTEPRTLEAVIYNHGIDTSVVLGRDGVLYKDVVTLSAPLLRAEVSSPLVVTGRARGTWYFEASFPVTLVDWDGKILAEGIATAEGDWMTEEFVPFKAMLTFTVPADIPYRRGALILKKDNPSGLPENDDAFEIPVTFKQ